MASFVHAADVTALQYNKWADDQLPACVELIAGSPKYLRSPAYA